MNQETTVYDLGVFIFYPNEEKMETFENYCFILGLLHPSSKEIYENAHTFVEKCCSIIFTAFVKITFPSVTIPFLIVCYVLYFTTDIGSDAFQLPFPAWYENFQIEIYNKSSMFYEYKYSHHRSPFDWRTPFGFLIAFLLEVCPVYYVDRNCACIVSLPLGSCRFMIAFANDIKAEFQRLNQHLRSQGNDMRFRKKVCELIEFHSVARRYVGTAISRRSTVV